MGIILFKVIATAVASVRHREIFIADISTSNLP